MKPGPSHLAFALLWMPRQRREDALVFYRFCREIDDIADDSSRPAPDRRRALDEWLRRIPEGLPSDLRDVVTRNEIRTELLAEIVRGCASDTTGRRFATYADLEEYCWRVACAVGMVSLRIFGCTDPASEAYAVNLGHALQLTNILRDVGEDAEMGRIYIPCEELDRWGVSERALLDGHPELGFVPMLRAVAGRARARYAAAVVPRDDRRPLAAAEIMRTIYLRILGRLEKESFPVFTKRIRLGRLEMAALALGVVVRSRLPAFSP